MRADARRASRAIDLDFRPVSYWPEYSRRPSARQLQADLLAATAPGFAAGVDLPRVRPGEVEIARVVIRSVLGDVVSVRARLITGGRIAYRVVDEHDERYVWSPRTSARPLSLRQLARAMDRSHVRGGNGYAEGLVWNQVDYDYVIHQHARSYSQYLAAVRVYSSFYPQLDELYQHRILDWLVEHDSRREWTTRLH